MKALFLRYLPLLIAALIAGGGLLFGPTAQARVVETVREMTPDSARQQLESWLLFLTWAIPAVAAVCSLIIAQILRLKEQLLAQGARHDEAIAGLAKAIPSKATAPPTIDAELAPAEPDRSVQTLAPRPVPGV